MAHSTYVQLEPNEIVERAEKAYPGGGDLVARAYAFAEKAHEGQFRKSGEPYFSHPCLVASILTDLMIDPPTPGLWSKTDATARHDRRSPSFTALQPVMRHRCRKPPNAMPRDTTQFVIRQSASTPLYKEEMP